MSRLIMYCVESTAVLLGLMMLLATIICGANVSLVAAIMVNICTYVGYTFAGLAGHRESCPDSWDTCGCHHIRASAAGHHQQAAQDIAVVDSRWEEVEQVACQDKT